jgi:kinesin family member 12
MLQIEQLEDIMAVVEEGNGNRRVASHLLNQDSSRSHSILTVYLQSEWADSVDGHIVKKFGKVQQSTAAASLL